MTIKAWKSQFSPDDNSAKEATFEVGQEDPDGRRGDYIGTTIDVSGPKYQNNFRQSPTVPDLYDRVTGWHGAEHPQGAGEPKSTLFDYEPGKVHGMFNDTRAPHTAGIAMGLAAQWHRTQGGELNVAHGMPTYSESLSSDSAPIAQRLAGRGLIPKNPEHPDMDVTNHLGRNDWAGTSHHSVYAEGEEVGPAEMKGARETLREVFGKKRTAPIQPSAQKSNGEQLKLL